MAIIIGGLVLNNYKIILTMLQKWTKTIVEDSMLDYHDWWSDIGK